MAVTQYYVDPGGGNDTTGTGAIGTPWKTVQHALDSITRNSTDGDQVNVKAGTADVLGAALSLVTYGTPTAAAPLIFRGYTATAADGGRGEIDGDGNGVISSAAPGIHFIDMKLGNTGANDILDLSGGYNICAGCELHHSSGFACDFTGVGEIVGNYFHDLTGNSAVDAGPHLVAYNYFNCAVTLTLLPIAASCAAIGNVIYVAGADTSVYGILAGGHGFSIIGNVVVSSNANTFAGIYAQYSYGMVLNNIVVGWSGAGGRGLDHDGAGYYGANAYYNNTSPETLATAKLQLSLGPSVNLAADPFVDAANGDFSLTAAAKAALRGVGWPAAYLGAHANTDGHITIGAIQYGEAEAGGGGAVRILPLRGSIG